MRVSAQQNSFWKRSAGENEVRARISEKRVLRTHCRCWQLGHNRSNAHVNVFSLLRCRLILIGARVFRFWKCQKRTDRSGAFPRTTLKLRKHRYFGLLLLTPLTSIVFRLHGRYRCEHLFHHRPTVNALCANCARPILEMSSLLNTPTNALLCD